MRLRTSAFFCIALAIAVGLGCDLTPGSKYDHRFSVETWDPIDGGNCLAIGTYVMGLDLSWNPAQGKSQIRLTPEFKQDRDFLPDGLELRYTLRRGMSTLPLYNLFYQLNKGKGKTDFILSPMTLLQGDEIDVEACNLGALSSTIPIHTRIDWRMSLKIDKDF